MFKFKCSREPQIIERLQNIVSRKKQKKFKWVDNGLLCIFFEIEHTKSVNVAAALVVRFTLLTVP